MNIKNKNTISNNPKFVNNKIIPAVAVNSLFNKKAKSLNALNSIKNSFSQKFLNSIESLKILSFDLKFISLSKEVVNTSIKNKTLIKSEIKNNLNQEVNLSSNLYNTILTYSDLLLEDNNSSSLSKLEKVKFKKSRTTNLESKVSDKTESQFKILPQPKMEKSGLFMSLVPYIDYYYYLSNDLFSMNQNKGKLYRTTTRKLAEAKIKDNNKLISYKIRHYLNLITKFNFNLSTSYYDFFQFKKTNKYLFKMGKAADLLKLAFLSKGCLISKPIFNLVYSQNNLFNGEEDIRFSNSKNHKLNKPKIIINLFYFVKTNEFDSLLLPSVTQTSSLKETMSSDKSNVIIDAVEKENLDYTDLNLKMAHTLIDQKKDKLIITKYNDKFIYLCDYLTKLFNSEVELELVRLYRPYQDSNILVQYLNSESYDRKFIKLVYRLFKRMKIYKKKNKLNKPSVKGIKGTDTLNTALLNEAIAYPSGISGINIKLAGRPINERIIPRFTVKRAQRGNFDRLSAKMIEKSMFTDKTKKGAFNFTVRLSHIFR